MSYISDYRCGALSYEDYKRECARENRMEKYYSEHEYDEYEENEEDEEG